MKESDILRLALHKLGAPTDQAVRIIKNVAEVCPGWNASEKKPADVKPFVENLDTALGQVIANVYVGILYRDIVSRCGVKGKSRLAELEHFIALSQPREPLLTGE